MKQYIGTKIINAIPMNRIEYNYFIGWELPKDENGNDEGYLVEYPDGGTPNTTEYAGYVSWSPKKQFEDAYKESGNLSFGDAIEYMKRGHKVSRSGWNGKGMFLTHIDPYINTQYQVIELEQIVGTLAPYIAMKTANNELIPWLASQADMLANDWCIV